MIIILGKIIRDEIQSTTKFFHYPIAHSISSRLPVTNSMFYWLGKLYYNGVTLGYIWLLVV